MNNKIWNLALILGLIITIIGLMTGRFFFLFLIFPIGFGFFKRKSKGDNDTDRSNRLE